MIHREKHIEAVSLAENFGPPISPPITYVNKIRLKLLITYNSSNRQNEETYDGCNQE